MSELTNCLCCTSTNLTNVLDLGSTPLANSYQKKQNNIPRYPLSLNVCKDCWHSQQTHIVPPDLMFRDYDYVSGTSKTMLDFFEKNATEVMGGRCRGKVLDIACNDGSQLDFFKGFETYGVDPAQNLYPVSTSKGHNVICSYWTREVARQLPIMDIILAQNVFAHTKDVDEFLQACHLIMDIHTQLMIQTSQRDMIFRGEFDTIYHEHISFFTPRSMKTLLERNNLYLTGISYPDVHGGSYIFHVSNRDKGFKIDNDSCLYNLSTYDSFREKALNTIRRMNETLRAYMTIGYSVVGFGAAAKGMTFIEQLDVKPEYIVDENPLKIGKYTPGTNIPIVDIETLRSDKRKLFILIPAWNFADEIISKIRECRVDTIVCSRYFPHIVLV